MSQAKENWMKSLKESDLVDFLEMASNTGEASDVLHGITKQVLNKGLNSLSDKQRIIVDNFVSEYTSNNICDSCRNDNVSSLTDYLFIAQDGRCPHCEAAYNKFMRE